MSALAVGAAIVGVAAVAPPGSEARRQPVAVEADAVTTAAGAPSGSDPRRGDQWDLARVRAVDAWPRSTGSGVTVAVLDTGVDATHPDLAGQVLPGYDAIARTAGDGTDPSGHGTHVAGIIAALTGNAAGISGIAPDVKILPVRVLNAMGTGLASDTAAGIVYAADHGAKVINMSFTTDARVAAVTNAVAYARSKGVVVVAAGGNGRVRGNPPAFPAAEPSVIAVAATDSADRPAVYSTRADYIDVAAPGSDILSTYRAGGYQALSGTSAAAAHVSAVAALVEAARPTLTPDQVERAITNSATDLGPAGRDPDFGYGLVNAAAALDAGTTGPSAPSAPSNPKRVAPAVRVSAPASAVLYGDTATIRYTVTGAGKPMAGLPVQIGLCPAGSAAFVFTDAVTDTTGVVEYAMPVTGRFQIRLTIPASTTNTAASSPISTVSAKSDVAVQSWDVGELTVNLTGPPGRTLQLQRNERGRWIADSTFPGAAEKVLTGLRSGTQYRVVLPAAADITGITSKGALVL